MPEREPVDHSSRSSWPSGAPTTSAFIGWRAIDQAEVEPGEPHGRPRIKFCTVAEMVEAARQTDRVAG